MADDTPSPFDSFLGKINTVVKSTTDAALQISRAVAGNPATVTAISPTSVNQNQTIAVVLIIGGLVLLGVLLWGSKR